MRISFRVNHLARRKKLRSLASFEKQPRHAKFLPPARSTNKHARKNNFQPNRWFMRPMTSRAAPKNWHFFKSIILFYTFMYTHLAHMQCSVLQSKVSAVAVGASSFCLRGAGPQGEAKRLNFMCTRVENMYSTRRDKRID